ncbi:hypothetical protein CANARDRAFT_206983 [[Candida] arabinofermentans NRRL YB-2248]|uniref:Uncharacterized protein n=1 Tax=[Candida] arabinofermentans NRRL YB-2248 TaxID=983967 RepID=A0A1E4T1Q9_9ASCO|nr:hypothetical protein CANARDRAFT_206983 [[Candida] arabinofermentans NRRL YB-2248]
MESNANHTWKEFNNLPSFATPEKPRLNNNENEQDTTEHGNNLKRSPTTPLTPSVGRQNIIRRKLYPLKGDAGDTDNEDPMLENVNPTQTSVIQIQDATKTSINFDTTNTTSNIYGIPKEEERYIFNVTPSIHTVKQQPNGNFLKLNDTTKDIFNHTETILSNPPKSASNVKEDRDNNTMQPELGAATTDNTDKSSTKDNMLLESYLTKIASKKARWMKDKQFDRMKETIEFLEAEREIELQFKTD